MSTRGTRTTLRDVAQAANVSPATVSRVLRGVFTGADDLRDRVHAAVQETGYQPNVAARQMRTGRTDRVALVVDDLRDVDTELLERLSYEASCRGLLLALWSLTHVPAHQDPSSVINAHEVDAIIQIRNPGATSKAMSAKAAVQIADRRTGESPDGSTDRLLIDAVAGGAAVARYFADSGAWNVSVVGDTGLHQERLTGFRSAARVLDLELPPSAIHSCANTRDGGEKSAVALVNGKVPDAVFALSDDVALGLIDGLRGLGISVPQHLWMVGYGNKPETALPPYRLSTLSVDPAELANQAFLLLDRRRANPHRPPQQVVIRPSLKLRHSSGPKLIPLAAKRATP